MWPILSSASRLDRFSHTRYAWLAAGPSVFSVNFYHSGRILRQRLRHRAASNGAALPVLAKGLLELT